MPSEFWDVEQMRDALASWHMGRVIAAYRSHPYHGGVVRQELVARWVGITQAQLSRIENGPAIKDLDRLAQWARVLAIPPHVLWFKLPEYRSAESTDHPQAAVPVSNVAESPSPPGAWEVDDMNRRELLRLLSVAGTATVTSRVDQLDWDRMHFAGRRPAGIDPATVDQYTRLNAHLWEVFISAPSKARVLPVAQSHLKALTIAMQSSLPETTRQRLCALVGDMLQLTGEILFDANQYTEAAHCYTLAVTVSREANAFDLWACALTRHAFIGLYERQFGEAVPMLDLAGVVAQQGDSTLSTRHWVHSVHAQALAGLGELDACQHALDAAEQVHQLNGTMHNGGWLRFDGSRLAEERGACYVELARPNLAETVLLKALGQDLSLRRRGGVLTDLAMTGVQRGDRDQVIMYANAALDTLRQTRSGVIHSRLQHLNLHLAPLLADGHIRHLSRQITELTCPPITQ